MDCHPARRDRLRAALAKTGAEALLVTDVTNVTYLTGFSGDDSYLLLHRGGDLLLSDPRYTTQISEECPGLDLFVRSPGVTILQAAVKVLRSAKIGRLAIEADAVSVAARERIAEKLSKVDLCPTCGLVEELRQIKDKGEIEAIRRAVRYAERAFAAVRASLRPEQSEKEIADELEAQMRRLGARQGAFPAIVGVGPRAALPHAVPGKNRIAESGFVLIDWGAKEALYHSDLTRVLVTGKILPKFAKFERIYRVVLEAQTRAIAAIRPGVTSQEIDAIARGTIARAGFGRRFGHGLGHGVGLAVHEAPRLAAKNPTVLRPGMVVTVEPGIYLPGWGGVRIEDDVLVTRNGHEVLTSLPKELEEVIVG